MKIEIVGVQKYNVIEIFDDKEKIYNYFLSKDGYGDWMFLYGTETKCPPIDIGRYVRMGEDTMNWD